MFAWELFIFVIEFSIFYLLINTKFHPRDYHHLRLLQIVTTFIFSVILNIINYSSLPVIFNTLGLNMCLFVCSLLFYTGPLVLHFFWTSIYMLICIFSDALTTMIPTTIFHIPLQNLLLNGANRIFFTIVYLIIILLFILILLLFSTNTFQLNIQEKITLIFLSILCILIEESIVISQSYDLTRFSLNQFLFVLFFLVMLVYICLLVLFYRLGVQRQKNRELLEEQIVSKLEKTHFSQIFSVASEIRFLKHDMKNHLEIINILNQTNKHEELRKYVTTLLNSSHLNNLSVSSGNIVLDSIFSYKLQLCKESEIKIDYTIHFPTDCSISDTDICSIIGNLFDNSIEACLKLPKEKRYIKVCIKPFQNMLSILFSNSSNGIYQYEKKIIQSTKTSDSSSSHGLGIKRVRNLVTFYDGFMEIYPSTDTFKVSILIPLIHTEIGDN